MGGYFLSDERLLDRIVAHLKTAKRNEFLCQYTGESYGRQKQRCCTIALDGTSASLRCLACCGPTAATEVSPAGGGVADDWPSMGR